MHAAHPSAGIPLTSSTAAPDAEVVWLIGDGNWPLTSHNAITTDFDGTYDRRHYRVAREQ